MTRLFTRSLFFSFLCFSLAALPAYSKGSRENPDPSPSTGENGYPAVFTDDLGETVTLKNKPARIVSGTLMSDEILLSLTDGSPLVAITQFSADPAVSNVADKAGSVKLRMPMNVEQYVALNPDLIFLADWTDAAAVRQLKDAGLQVFRISTPSTFEEIAGTVEKIAGVIGEANKGKELTEWMNVKLSSVRDRVSGVRNRPTVMDYSIWGTSMGKSSSWDEIIRAAGLVNAVADRTANEWGSVPVSKELLLELDPDILVLPGWTYGDPSGADTFHASVANDPALKGLTAIRKGKLIRISEAHRSTTSHFMALAVEDLAREAYPELFK